VLLLSVLWVGLPDTSPDRLTSEGESEDWGGVQHDLIGKVGGGVCLPSLKASCLGTCGSQRGGGAKQNQNEKQSP